MEVLGGKIRVGDTCKNGHLIDGDNAQFYNNRGTPCVRCKTCSTFKTQQNPPYKEGDTCAKGHVIAGDNLYVQKSNNKKSFRCRTCRRTWANELRKKKSEEKQKAAPLARELHIILTKKIEETKPNCYNRPTLFVDYDEDSPPTSEFAKLLCYECPLIRDCYRFAKAEKPAIGVWAGSVWDNGRIVK